MKIGESLPLKNIEIRIESRLPARALDVGGVNEVIVPKSESPISIGSQSQVPGQAAPAPYSSFAVHYPLTAAAMFEEGDVELLDAPQETQREGRTIGTLAEGEVEDIPNYSALENCLNDVAQLVDKFENTVLIDNEFMELRKQLEDPLIQQYMRLSPEHRDGVFELAAKLRDAENYGKWDDTVLTPETLEPYLPLLFQYIHDASIVRSKIDEEDMRLSHNRLTEVLMLKYVNQFHDLVAAGTVSLDQASNLYAYALDPQVSSRELFVATWRSQATLSGEGDGFMLHYAIVWNGCNRMSAELAGRMMKTLHKDKYIHQLRLVGEMLFDWGSSMSMDVPHNDRQYYLEQNIECLRQLGKGDAECTAFLDMLLGVRCYGRYSPEMLKEQKNLLISKDHGLLLSSIEDHNGSSYHHREILSEFYQEQKSDEVHMVPMEANSLRDALKKMIYLRKILEAKGGFVPFKYLILQTHGGKDSVSIGPAGKWRGESLAENFVLVHEEEEELYGDRIRRFWNTFFDPTGSLVLVSCVGGAEGGIAERLSRILPEVKVVASRTVSYLNHMQYNKGDIQASFIGSGQTIGEIAPELDRESVVYYRGGIRIDPDAKNPIN